MNKTKIVVVIIGGAVTGGLGAAILVMPDQGAIFAGIIGVVTMAVATFTGITLNKGE